MFFLQGLAAAAVLAVIGIVTLGAFFFLLGTFEQAAKRRRDRKDAAWLRQAQAEGYRAPLDYECIA